MWENGRIMTQADKKHLLKRCCEGRLSIQEQEILRRWSRLNDDNKKKAQDLLKLYRHYKAAEAFDAISYESGLAKTLASVKAIKKRRRITRLTTIAASVAAILILFLGVRLLLQPGTSVQQPTLATAVQPGESKATLILGSGEQLILDDLKDSLISSQSGALIKKDDKLLDYTDLDTEKSEINIIRTPRGGEYNLLLADGTKVWLNAETELKYPVSFTGAKREVHLSGEAYLEVAHNPDQPFIVHTSKGAVEVLGTAFNIKDYSDEKQMFTTLVEGKVRLSNALGTEAILNPSTQGVVSADKEIELKDVDVSLYTAWKDGLFAFRNQPLGQIIKDLSRWYDFDYWFANNQLKEIRFTGEIKRYESAESLLRVLEKTYEVRFEYAEGTLLIK